MIRPLPVLLAWARRFGRDRRGVSALEFALIAPVMVTTYFGLAELSDGMQAQRRVSHAASAVGDLVAQAESLSNAEKTNVFAAASAIVAPYPTTDKLMIRISSITMDAKGKARVDWSDGSKDLAAFKHCDEIKTLPTGLLTTAGENVVMAEATYSYSSPIAKILPKGLNFSETFYLRPRKSSKVGREGADTSACT